MAFSDPCGANAYSPHTGIFSFTMKVCAEPYGLHDNNSYFWGALVDTIIALSRPAPLVLMCTGHMRIFSIILQ